MNYVKSREISNDANSQAGLEAVRGNDVYRTLLESTKAIPWRIEWGSKQFSYIGPQIEDLLGWDQSSWRHVEDWAVRMHPEDSAWVVPFCVKQSEAGVDHEADYRALAADHSYRWIRDVVHVVRSSDGEVEALVGFMFDISERKKTEEQLAELQQHLERLVQERTRQLTEEIEKRQELEREVSEVAEEERRRIGRELHDDLGQRLTGVSLLAQALANEVVRSAPALSETADMIQRSASAAVSQVRALAHGLMPTGPDAQGLQEALKELAKEASCEGTTCRFLADQIIDVEKPDVATHLYRIAQEGLTNALRHAKAKMITLRLDLIDGRIAMSIVDDGSGETPGERGRGLSIMEYRASLINFSFAIDFQAGRGTRIDVIAC